MSIKNIVRSKAHRNKRIARNYFIASAAVAAFGGVYEYFSHGVYSAYMICAFLIPLLLGCLPHLADGKGRLELAGELYEKLMICSIATLTAGSVMKGVLEIYGTTNILTTFYPLIGIAAFAAAQFVLIVNTALKRAAGS